MSIDDHIDQLVKRETARASLEWAANAKGVLPSAVEELAENVWCDRFLASGKTAQKFVDDLPISRPHIMPETFTDKQIAEARPMFATLQGRGEYVKANGEAAYNRMLAALGASPRHLLMSEDKPSTTTPTSRPNKAPEDRRNNPWAESFKGTEDEKRARQISIIKSLGTKAASSMAASAGTDLAGRPLRK